MRLAPAKVGFATVYQTCVRKEVFMSFDLAVWHYDGDLDPERAQEIYEGILEELPGIVAENEAVTQFHDNVVSVFPDLTAENMEQSVWSAPIYSSSSFFVANISWSKQALVSQALIALARKHGLICYDPQAREVFR